MNDFNSQPELTNETVRLRPLQADDWDALFARDVAGPLGVK